MAPEAPLVTLLVEDCDEEDTKGIIFTLEVTVVILLLIDGEMVRLDDTTTSVEGLE